MKTLLTVCLWAEIVVSGFFLFTKGYAAAAAFGVWAILFQLWLFEMEREGSKR